jgi:hypothetical protein
MPVRLLDGYGDGAAEPIWISGTPYSDAPVTLISQGIVSCA